MKTEILVVEDDPVLGPVTCDVLIEHGHSAELADSVDSAFEQASKRADLEVILLDLQLGADRGEALIERLRDAHIKVPAVVIFSALPAGDLVEVAGRVDAIGVLQKPTQPSAILAAIAHAVQNARF